MLQKNIDNITNNIAELYAIKKTIESKGINTAAKPAINSKICSNSHEANDLLRAMNTDVLSAEPTGREITIKLAVGEKSIRK